MKRINKYFASIKDVEWLSIKIPLAYVWLIVLRDSLKGLGVIIEPKGICNILDCSMATGNLGYWAILLISFVLGVFYLFEIRMKWTTLGMCFISILVFSAEESTGILKRNGTLSFLFFAQSTAYWVYYSRFKKLALNRIQFSVQAITVGYFLSACSKLLDAGLSWPFDGQRISLQVLKSFHYSYYTELDVSQLAKANDFVLFLSDSKGLLLTALITTLIMEFFSLTAVLNKTYARVYGIALLLMHLGIYYFMDVLITSFAIPMVIVLINPIFLGLLLFKRE